MFAVILAAGRGVRMGDLTTSVPKPMISFRGKPLLEHTFSALPLCVTDVVLVVGYLHQVIEQYFGDFYGGRRVHYVVQKNLNGTGGAVLLARDFVKDSSFLVLMGDDLYCSDDLLFLSVRANSVMGFYCDPVPSRFDMWSIENNNPSVVKDLVSADGVVAGFANVGAYHLSMDYFSFSPVVLPSGEFGLPQTLMAGCASGGLYFVAASHWSPVGTVEELLFAQNNW
ncbi:MAG: nucleotidyltransferase family protein [Candidatus Moranbacteria bacterium]|nr:nucleotidyltransferase family protein [Candidatus Moranbacteria bacterium]